MAIGTKPRSIQVAGLAMLAASLFFPLAAKTEARTSEVFVPTIRYGVTDAGFEYMSGGLTNDQRQFMERRSAPYNLKLVLVRPRAMSLAPLRLFLANNATGRIEDFSPSGPWNYLRLPPGTYTIGARIGRRIFLLRDILIQENLRQTLILKDSQL
jgi:hypothetical protein